jgi:hypothetical protein
MWSIIVTYIFQYRKLNRWGNTKIVRLFLIWLTVSSIYKIYITMYRLQLITLAVSSVNIKYNELQPDSYWYINQKINLCHFVTLTHTPHHCPNKPLNDRRLPKQATYLKNRNSIKTFLVGSSELVKHKEN